MSQIEDLLQRCTVKLTLPDRMGWGTGFFVAPGLILTCAHVVREAGDGPVLVRWQAQENWAEAYVEELRADPDDLALLRVRVLGEGSPPCVWLDEAVRSRDPLYLFGYPDQDFPNGCPVTFGCEGWTGDEPALIKFALGQVRPGMSGSPLLNQRTGMVCGIVKFTRDRSFDLGGGAIPTRVILEQFPKFRELQREFHKVDRRWSDLLTKISAIDFQAYLGAMGSDWQRWLKRHRHGAIVGGSLLILLTSTAIVYSLKPELFRPALTAIGLQQNQQRKVVKILVADFGGNDQNKLTTDSILKAIRSKTQDYKNINIKVDALKQEITERDGGKEKARKIGQEQKANIVIWGSYVETGTTVQMNANLELLMEPKVTSMMTTITKGTKGVPWAQTINMPISQLERISSQLDDLQQQSAYLVLMVLGLSSYVGEDWDQAINYFTNALDSAREIPKQLKAASYFYRANSYAGKKDFKKATSDYEQARNFSPKLVEAYLGLGTAYIQQGYLEKAGEASLLFEEAIKSFNQAISLNTSSKHQAYAYKGRGIAYIIQGIKSDRDLADNFFDEEANLSFEKGIKSYEEVIKIDSKDAETHTLSCGAYLLKKRLDKAILSCNQAISLSSNFTGALKLRGYLYTLRGQYPEAIQDFKKATDLDSADAESYFSLGLAYGLNKEEHQAIQSFDQAITLNPEFALAYRSRGDAYNAKGGVLQQNQDADAAEKSFDAAIESFNLAIKFSSKDPIAYVGLGTAYLNKKDPEQAIKSLNQAITYKPDYALAYIALGDIYSTQKDGADLAVENYTQAINYDSRNSYVYQRRCFIYLGQQNSELAISDCDEAITYDSKNAWAYLGRAAAYRIKNDFDQAISNFNEVLKIPVQDNKVYVLAYINRGDAYNTKKDPNPDQAISSFNEALKLDDKNADAYVGRGYSYTMKKEPDQAISSFNEALKLDDKNARIYNGLGDSYRLKNERVQAISNYQKALTLNPDPEAKSYAQKKLSELGVQ
jgi:tetratricopeptide (TPR) repeat protein